MYIIWYNVDMVISQLPIACYNSMIKGRWQLQMSEPTEYDYGLSNSCGHQIPDQTDSSYKAMQYSFIVHKTFLMNLMEDGRLDSE